MVHRILTGVGKHDHKIKDVKRRPNTCADPKVDPKRKDRLKEKMRQRLSKRLRSMQLAFYFLCIPAIIIFTLLIINGIFDIWTDRNIFGGRAGGVAIGAMVIGSLMIFGVVTDMHATRKRLDKIK